MNVIDRIKSIVKKEQETEGDWQAYLTLAIAESIPATVIGGIERHPLYSAEVLAANRNELNRLRRQFWNDDRSPVIDPARPKTLAEIPEAVTA